MSHSIYSERKATIYCKFIFFCSVFVVVLSSLPEHAHQVKNGHRYEESNDFGGNLNSDASNTQPVPEPGRHLKHRSYNSPDTGLQEPNIRSKRHQNNELPRIQAADGEYVESVPKRKHHGGMQNIASTPRSESEPIQGEIPSVAENEADMGYTFVRRLEKHTRRNKSKSVDSEYPPDIRNSMNKIKRLMRHRAKVALRLFEIQGMDPMIKDNTMQILSLESKHPIYKLPNNEINVSNTDKDLQQLADLHSSSPSSISDETHSTYPEIQDTRVPQIHSAQPEHTPTAQNDAEIPPVAAENEADMGYDFVRRLEEHTRRNKSQSVDSKDSEYPPDVRQSINKIKRLMRHRAKVALRLFEIKGTNPMIKDNVMQILSLESKHPIYKPPNEETPVASNTDKEIQQLTEWKSLEPSLPEIQNTRKSQIATNEADMGYDFVRRLEEHTRRNKSKSLDSEYPPDVQQSINEIKRLIRHRTKVALRLFEIKGMDPKIKDNVMQILSLESKHAIYKPSNEEIPFASNTDKEIQQLTKLKTSAQSEIPPDAKNEADIGYDFVRRLEENTRRNKSKSVDSQFPPDVQQSINQIKRLMRHRARVALRLFEIKGMDPKIKDNIMQILSLESKHAIYKPSNEEIPFASNTDKEIQQLTKLKSSAQSEIPPDAKNEGDKGYDFVRRLEENTRRNKSKSADSQFPPDVQQSMNKIKRLMRHRARVALRLFEIKGMNPMIKDNVMQILSLESKHPIYKPSNEEIPFASNTDKEIQQLTNLKSSAQSEIPPDAKNEADIGYDFVRRLEEHTRSNKSKSVDSQFPPDVQQSINNIKRLMRHRTKVALRLFELKGIDPKIKDNVMQILSLESKHPIYIPSNKGIHVASNTGKDIEQLTDFKSSEPISIFDEIPSEFPEIEVTSRSQGSALWTGVGVGLGGSLALIIIAAIVIFVKKRYYRCSELKELSFCNLTPEPPNYVKLSHLHKAKNNSRYIVTVLDESKHSDGSDSMWSSDEEEIFDVSNLKSDSPVVALGPTVKTRITSTPIKNKIKSR